MRKNACDDCINREICGQKKIENCEHYDVVFTRSEVFNILSNVKNSNPSFVPSILNAIRRTYRINLSY